MKRNRILNQIGVFFVTCLFSLLSSQMAIAACTGSSPSWTTTPDYTSFSSCVSRATAGDTINVSPGSATWSSGVTISKQLTIIGAGMDSTVITYNGTSNNALDINADNWRLSGIGFILPLNNVIMMSVGGQGWRIDHCKYTNNSAANGETVNPSREFIHTPSSQGVTKNPYGVIDNNVIINGRITTNADAYPTSVQNSNWNSAIALGSVNNIYVEDNTFTRPDGANAKNVIDYNYGGKAVVRFNTIDGQYISVHGHSGSTSRAGKEWEIYGNVITTTEAATYNSIFIGAGTGVVFDNLLNGSPTYQIAIKNNRSYETNPPLGVCSASNPYDGTGTNGYPCRDQIGRGTDESLLTYDSGSYPAQPLVPAYFWGNTHSSVNQSVFVDTTSGGGSIQSSIIQANRDYYDYTASFTGASGVGKGTKADMPQTCTEGTAYWVTDEADWNSLAAGNDGQLYKCTAADTWTLYYTPYTYPHPLRSGVETKAQSTLAVTSVNGTVTSNPAGINCGSTCSENYGAETSVTLTAVPNSGYTFTGWSGGGCSGTGACIVTMTEAKSVAANYGISVYNLAVTKPGTGTGTVTGSDGLINCGSTCSVNYDSGKVVTLTALANSGAVFSGWSGGGCAGTGTCTATMTEAKSVAATFIPVYKLTVTKSVAGAGTITSSNGTINCGSTCSANYNPGTSETLTASANSGYTFTGWSGGGCSGTGTCTVTMTAATSVTATFATSVYNLAVTKSGTGTGTVTGSDGLINCGSTCSVNYESGKSVTLAASASSGSTFSGWSGGCAGTGTCTVTMTAAKSVTATFATSVATSAPSVLYKLTVTKSGTGSGTVTSSPSGISCGSTCSANYTSGTVTLAASAKIGSTFSGWSGVCSGTGTCTVNMTAAKSVTATFAKRSIWNRLR